jgi:hypothetical protein
VTLQGLDTASLHLKLPDALANVADGPGATSCGFEPEHFSRSSRPNSTFACHPGGALSNPLGRSNEAGLLNGKRHAMLLLEKGRALIHGFSDGAGASMVLARHSFG